MRVAGFLLLPAGWLIGAAAVVLLKSATPQASFIVAGLAVQFLGIVLAAKTYVSHRGGHR